MTWEHKGDVGTFEITGVTWEHFFNRGFFHSIGKAINSVICPIELNY